MESLQDKKLIELAAKAVNRKIKYNCLGFQHADYAWNPLVDNSAAFQLFIDCDFNIELEDDCVVVNGRDVQEYQLYENHGDDKQKAVRVAITKAAAKRGTML